MNFQSSSKQSSPLSHTHEAKGKTTVSSRFARFRIKAFAVVFDEKHRVGVPEAQSDAHTLRLSVSDNVGDRLLSNAKDHRFDLRGEAFLKAYRPHRHLNTQGLEARFGVPIDGLDEPKVI
jgi:hypothetical protein